MRVDLRFARVIECLVWVGVSVLLAPACGGGSPGGEDAGDTGSCTDESCDDGVYCNGAERCSDGRCVAGSVPCEAELCREATRSCESDCAVPDADGDGRTAIACGGDDCDDRDANRSPGATEVCDTGNVDEDCNPITTGDRDADGDGYVSSACCNLSEGGTLFCAEDCDDSRRGANPNAPEVCDTIDNDCDGSIDEAVIVRCYFDGDGDGYALIGAAFVEGCECPVRTTARPPTDAADCDDTLADVSPDDPEICSNDRDDDCDGTTDEEGNDWFPDCDGDGFGVGPAVRQCTSPGRPAGCTALGAGHVLRGDDCDDSRADAHPDSVEICNGLDDTCDGTADEGPEPNLWCSVPSRLPPFAASAECRGGACEPTSCTGARLDCAAGGGCETEGDIDASNCGACGNVCTWDVCSSGRCDPIHADSDGNGVGCAVRVAGTVACWRSDENPTFVEGLENAVEVAVGPAHACARLAGGAVACWGANRRGQLGDGTTMDRSSPVTVVGLTDAVEIAVGDEHSCARRTSGAVACWGSNSSGEVGVDTGSTDVPTPVQPAVAGIVEIAAGGTGTCARAASGLWCWGRHYYHGVGVTTRRSPVAISTTGIGTIAQMEMDGRTCLREVSGRLLCWGGGVLVAGTGSLGTGVPTPMGITDVSSFAFAGNNDLSIVRADTAAWLLDLRDGSVRASSTGGPGVLEVYDYDLLRRRDGLYRRTTALETPE